MNFKNYTTANTHPYTIGYFISLTKVKGVQLTKQCLSQVQTIFGDIIEECKGIGRSSRELQTRLEEPMLVRLLLSTYLFKEPSDLSKRKANSSNQSQTLIRLLHRNTITNPINEVLRTMKKIIIALLTLTLIGGLVMSTDMSMFTSLSFFPLLAGITFNWRKKKVSIATPLPEAFDGLRDSDMNKITYITSQVKQVDKENVYVNQVSQVTRQAEDQWNRDHPDFERIRTNIVDNDYRNLVQVYLTAGLDIPNAFCNTLIAIVRKYGSSLGDSYSIDKSIGQFSDFVESDLMENEYRSELILNAIYKLRDEYGVTFTTLPTTTASEDGYNVTIIDVDKIPLEKNNSPITDSNCFTLLIDDDEECDDLDDDCDCCL